MAVAKSFGTISPAWATIYFNKFCFSAIVKAQLQSSLDLPHDNIDFWILFECLQSVWYVLLLLNSLSSTESSENIQDNFFGVEAASNTCVLEFFLPSIDSILPLMLDSKLPPCGTLLCNYDTVSWLAVLIVNIGGDMMDDSFSFESNKFICYFKRLF